MHHIPDRRQLDQKDAAEIPRPQFFNLPGHLSGPLPKFVIHRGTTRHELRKQRGTSNSMILVPLFDLKFLTEFAATAVGTSNGGTSLIGRNQAKNVADRPST